VDTVRALRRDRAEALRLSASELVGWECGNTSRGGRCGSTGTRSRAYLVRTSSSVLQPEPGVSMTAAGLLVIVRPRRVLSVMQPAGRKQAEGLPCRLGEGDERGRTGRRERAGAAAVVALPLR